MKTTTINPGSPISTHFAIYNIRKEEKHGKSCKSNKKECFDKFFLKKIAILTRGKDESFRTLYHGETKMIETKSRQSYIWSNRKGAKKPNPRRN